MAKKCNCMRCEHVWWPNVSDPKQCPRCGSKVWRKPQTTDPQSVKEIYIYNDVHLHHGSHFIIYPRPTFSQSQILSLLMEMLKATLTDDYRIDGEKIRKPRIDDPRYFENILKLVDEDRPHVVIERDDGMELFVRTVKLCFPNAKVEIADSSDSNLEEKLERWRINKKIR